MIGAEFIHITGEQRAGEIALGAFAAGQPRVLQQIFAVAVATGAFSGGTLHRNFQGYSTHGECDLVGLGMSAIGHVGGCYSQNARDLASYYEHVAAGRLPIVRGITLEFDDVLRADLIQSVMCRNRLDFASAERRFGIRFDEYFARELVELTRLAADGLVQLGEYGFVVTPRGRLLLRVIAMVFDASLRKREAPPPRFSRVI